MIALPATRLPKVTMKPPASSANATSPDIRLADEGADAVRIERDEQSRERKTQAPSRALPATRSSGVRDYASKPSTGNPAHRPFLLDTLTPKLARQGRQNKCENEVSAEMLMQTLLKGPDAGAR